jgi:CelD/BcsL family acetyltransferase involved in cellulose biosynthesis
VSPISPVVVVEVAATLAAMEALASEWGALEQETPEGTGFQSYVWCRNWADAAGDSRLELRVVILREDGRLSMLWPLQIETVLGVRVARWLGEPMTQYGDALALPGQSRAHWRAAIEAELAGWTDVDLFAFMRMRSDGVLAACGFSGERSGEALAAPFVNLRARPARRHKSAERRGRRLSAAGEPALRLAASREERRDLASKALALKQEWLRAKGLISAGLSNKTTAGFIDLLAQSDFLQIHALTFGTEVAAIDIGFTRGDAYRSLLGCYDVRFSEGSPGHALTRRLIAHYAAEGLGLLDFLAPADAYKLAFASGATPLVARFSARTPRGAVAGFALKWLRPAAKRLLALRAGWTFARGRRSLWRALENLRPANFLLRRAR